MRPLPAILSCCLGVLCGCSAELSNQQIAMLEDGQQAYRASQYSAAVSQLSRFLGEAKERPEAAQAAYVRGLAYARLGRRPEAVGDLRRAAGGFAEREIRWRANLALSTIYFEDGNWAAAARSAAAAAEHMPARPPRDVALFRVGQCQERLGRWDEARSAFSQVERLFPNTDFGEAARRRLSLGARAFSVQCGVYGDEKNAQNLQARLKTGGVDSIVKRESRAGRALFIVYAGTFSNYENAERQLGLVKRIVPDAVLIP